MMLLCCALALAMSPDEAVRAASQNDPALVQAESALSAAKGAHRSASWLRSNPELDVSADIGGRRIGASITQDVSLSGAGFADARSGRFAVEAAEAEFTRARIVTAANARRAWARLAAAEGVLRAAVAEKTSAGTVRVATEAKRRAGEVSDLDLHLARLEEARAIAGWLEAIDERIEAQAALAALTGDAHAAAEGDPLAAAPRPGSVAPRSDLAAADARVESARAALARERAEVLPALGVGAFVEQEGDHSLVGPVVQVELPLWQQNAGGRGAAKGELAVAEAEAAAARARAKVEGKRAGERLVALDSVATSLSPGVDESAAAAAAGIDLGVSSGELSAIDAAFLRVRVYEGQRGWYAARLAETEGRIDAALAVEDGSLLSP